MKRNAALMMLLLLLAMPSAGQDLYGRIEGTVTDPQGAVIPGAEVTATHVGTNITYKATTSAVGHFAIQNARLGEYRIAVESQGFRRAVVEGVSVEIGSVLHVNLKLELGEVTQEVTVSAEAAQEIVNTTNTELGATVSPKQVLELPLNGRNAAELLFLQPGTYYETDPDGQGDKLFVHGQRARSINFTLDGVDTQDNLNRSSAVMINQPSLALAAENVQEFRVATGVSSAEFTRGGSQVTAVTRSGSNNWHGSAFWFHRNTVLDANDVFNNIAGQDRPPLLRHQFGGRVGGPIWKDKAFFFFGYQQTREKRAIPVHRVVYSQAARQGIFQWIDSSGTTRSVNLLECSANVQAVLGRNCVDSRFNNTSPQVSGGQITLDPFILSNILGNMPLPNIAGGDGLNTQGFRFNSDTLTYEHLPSFRLDYRINDKHLFYGSWNYTDRNIIGDFINGGEPVWPTLDYQRDRVTHTNGFVGALVSNFTPTSVNEFRLGRVGAQNRFGRNQPFTVPWTLDFDDITDPYDFDGGTGTFRNNVTWHVRDTYSMVWRNHQFKFGGEWRRRLVDNVSFLEVLELGEIDFNDSDSPPGFTATNLRNLAGASSNPNSTNLNNAEEQLNNLIGFIGSVEARYTVNRIDDATYAPYGTPERRIYFNNEFDVFVQDNWNLFSNLSLNLGLRWEWAGIPDEKHGLILLPEGGADGIFGNSGPDGLFNPGTLTGKPCPQLGNVSAPAGADLDALFDMCAVANVPGGDKNGLPLYNNDMNNFGPVVGVAWDPFKTGKTSVRFGYRISYAQDVFSVIDGNVDDNAGLLLNHDCAPLDFTCQNNLDGGVGDPPLLRDIVDGSGNVILSGPAPVRAPPSSFVLPVVTHIQNTGDNALDLRAFADNLATEYYHEWSFGIQRELFRNWALEVRYVGTRGRNLRRVADFNELNITAIDPGGPGRPSTGQSFLDAFLIARNNQLACDAANSMVANSCQTAFMFNAAVSGSQANPFMDLLVSPEQTRFAGIPGSTSTLPDATLLTALREGSTGDFLQRYLNSLTSEPNNNPGTSHRRIGGAFYGLALRGQLPLNFFNVNPFIASARQLIGDGESNYNALEIEMRRRTAGGFAFQGNYTFQRAISDYDGDANELLNDVRPSSVRNPRYTSQEFMPRHVFTSNWVYELPFGQGKRLDAENPFVRKMIGGWQLGGIIQWRSGRPLSITSGLGMFHRSAISGENTVNLSAATDISGLRALTGQLNITTTDANTGQSLPGIFWFDPCLSSQVNGALTGGPCTADPKALRGLFTLPNPGELGVLPQSVIFGPRRFVFDFNFSKRTKLTESTELEFRWEVFNAFNNVNFGTPTTDIFDNDFGRIFRTITRPREMQFAFKINF
jgi:hypothetical protein